MKLSISVSPIIQYVKLAFSDGGSPSSSRILSLLHSLVACGTLIYVSIHNHALPDGTTLTGLGAFVTAPYAINRVTNAWGKDQGPKPEASLPPGESK